MVDQALIFAVKFDGRRKLISLGGCKTFHHLQSQVIDKWPDLKQVCFSFFCSFGSLDECELECDDDILNVSYICSSLKTNVVDVSVRLCEPKNDFDANSDIPTPTPNTLVSDINPPPDFSGDSCLPSYDLSPALGKSSYLSDSWVELMKGGVGAVFPGGAVQFRDSLIKYSTRLGFLFKFVRNSSLYIHVVCSEVDEGCDWFIKAKKKTITNEFVIYKSNLSHLCAGKLVNYKGKRFASRIIGQLTLQDIKSKPTMGGSDLVNLFRINYGIEIPYQKGWRASQSAYQNIFGSYDDSYDNLRWYVEAVHRTNPGSVAFIEKDEVSHEFQRLFLSFNASIVGFQYCRPMLFLDGTFLKGRSKGILLSATAKDGNNGLFPVAFAIVSAENTSNWTWFIQHVKDNVKHQHQIFYISDRNTGILAAFNQVFVDDVHFFCLFHLLSNLRGRFSKGCSNRQRVSLCDLFNACAYAPTKRLFDENMKKFIQFGGKMAEDWVAELPLEKWAIAYSNKITRYGELTSNAAESFNSWLVDARSLPVTNCCDWIRKNVARWFVERRKLAENWSTPLVPVKDAEWGVLSEIGMSWSVVTCPGGDYEVLSDISCSVDLKKRFCSCHRWQTTGFPCAHAVAVIQRHCNSIYTYIDECYFTQKYKQTYEANINPVPQTLKFEVSDSFEKILPPSLNRMPGRPKKSRITSYGEFPKKKVKPTPKANESC